MLKHKGTINSITLIDSKNSSETWLVTSSMDSSIIIWPLENYSFGSIYLETKYDLSEHLKSVECLIELNNEYLTSASDDHTIILWDYIKNVTVKNFTGHTNDVFGLIQLPDENNK